MSSSYSEPPNVVRRSGVVERQRNENPLPPMVRIIFLLSPIYGCPILSDDVSLHHNLCFDKILSVVSSVVPQKGKARVISIAA